MISGKKALLLFAALLVMASCSSVKKEARPAVASSATAAAGSATATPAPDKQISAPGSALPRAEQEKLAWKEFGRILDITASGPRRTILPELEQGYHNIISNYPDASLARESYQKLISICLEDYEPPKVEQAEQLYAEFNRKYPGAPVKALIDDQFARFYYRHQMWVKLLALTKPAIKDYIETRKLKSPFFLFLYSEAKLATGDPGEAEKGFKTVIKLFPGSSEAKISHSRLEGFQPKPGK